MEAEDLGQGQLSRRLKLLPPEDLIFLGSGAGSEPHLLREGEILFST